MSGFWEWPTKMVGDSDVYVMQVGACLL